MEKKIEKMEFFWKIEEIEKKNIINWEKIWN